MDDNSTIDVYFEITTEKFLELEGSEWFLDALTLFLVAPMGVLGALLNLLGLVVIFKMKQEQQSMFLYKMLKFYCVNSFLQCIFSIGSFWPFANRYIGYKFEYATNLLRNLARVEYLILF